MDGRRQRQLNATPPLGPPSQFSLLIHDDHGDVGDDDDDDADMADMANSRVI